jgi:hypothetical protein
MRESWATSAALRWASLYPQCLVLCLSALHHARSAYPMTEYVMPKSIAVHQSPGETLQVSRLQEAFANGRSQKLSSGVSTIRVHSYFEGTELHYFRYHFDKPQSVCKDLSINAQGHCGVILKAAMIHSSLLLWCNKRWLGLVSAANESHATGILHTKYQNSWITGIPPVDLSLLAPYQRKLPGEIVLRPRLVSRRTFCGEGCPDSRAVVRLRPPCI